MKEILTNINAPSKRALHILAVCMIAVSVYFNTLMNGFVHDDLFQVLKNPWISDYKNIPMIFKTGVWGFFTTPSNYYRPVMHLLYMLDYYLFGLAPWGFHLTNIILHMANCVLVFLVTEKLLNYFRETNPTTLKIVPVFTAVIFAIHPIHTESVTWVAGIPDLSYTLFYLFSLYLFLISNNKDGSTNYRLIFISAALFFIALLSKEPAATLPLILLNCDYLHGKLKFGISIFKKYLPYLSATCIYLYLRFWALGGFTYHKPTYNLTDYQSFINTFPLFFDYLKKLVLPYNLNAFYTFHPVLYLSGFKPIMSVLVAVAFLLTLIVSLVKRSIVSVGLLFIAIPLLPSLYIAALAKNVFAERYLYLSVFGFGLLFSLSVSQIIKSRPNLLKPIALSLAMLAVFYSAGTFSRNKVWKDNLTLFEDTVVKSPDSADVHNNLGVLYLEAGEQGAAEDHFIRTIELEPLNMEAHGNLGIIYMRKGELAKATNKFLFILEQDPNNLLSHYNLGIIYAKMFKVDEAVNEFTKVISISPLYADAHSNLGIIYAKTGQPDKAVNELQTAIKLNPNDYEAHQFLGLINRSSVE